MPLPSDLELHRGTFRLSNRIGTEFTGITTPRLESAVNRFYGTLERETGLEMFPDGEIPMEGVEGKLIVKCANRSPEYPSPATDESYRLRISKKRILLEAPNETGILFGLETLLQLVNREEDGWGFPAVTIKDEPRYPWRGLMIDACRHWIPKEVILRNLDGMAAVKMNVLHWHLSEYQGFRVESKVFPKLHKLGSDGLYYTQEEIREVINYAADRGIRVVPEFDLPGHSTSWFVGYPELASAPGPYALDTVFGVLKPLMDPTREEVYSFLDRFFGEMSALFPDAYIHIGGDEVATDHWDENPGIRKFMEEQNLEDAHALQAYFNRRLHRILKDHGKKMMGWDEILHPGLPAEGITVQSWRSHASLWEAARKGNKAVLSAGYYLDHMQPAANHYRVDPAIIPGAVDVEIDSSHWKGWDCLIEVTDLTMDAELYLFGEGEPMQGIISFMEGTYALQEITLEGNRLRFSIESAFGMIAFETETEGDSIHGEASIALFKLKLTGARSGGTDLEGGRPLPVFTLIEPLSDEQRENLLGGEACIWSEKVDARTMESRVWPRAAAIAEKLWSPPSLTANTEDMYRRLWILEERLESRGLRHRAYREEILNQWVEESSLDPLRNFILLLQEDLFFNRMVIYHPELYTTTPLCRVVDAAPAESKEAVLFEQAVDRWLETGNPETGDRLRESMKSWQEISDRLIPLFESTPQLGEVEPHLHHLSRLAELGLVALNGGSPPPSDSTIQVFFEEARSAYGGTLLKVADPVQKLTTGTLGK
jgi:hexosaminidase